MLLNSVCLGPVRQPHRCFSHDAAEVNEKKKNNKEF